MDKSFSERYGYVEASQVIQIESLNKEVRIGIWNSFYIRLWESGIYSNEARLCSKNVWVDFLGREADSLPQIHTSTRLSTSQLDIIKNFISSSEWYRVLDLVEFMLGQLQGTSRHNITESLNKAFRKFNVAYTVINGLIIPVSNKEEIDTIQNALISGYESPRQHFERSVQLFSDREQPDYRNSIKESISAIESLCKKITGNDKATLGDCLKLVESKGYIHPAMKSAFSQLYGYTSDQSGVRHALKDGEQEPTLEDARFMLIACSAFSNYLLSKMGE